MSELQKSLFSEDDVIAEFFQKLKEEKHTFKIEEEKYVKVAQQRIKEAER